jgi:hypothetical protein
MKTQVVCAGKDCGRTLSPMLDDIYPTLDGAYYCAKCWLRTVVGPAVEEERAS